MQNECIYCSAYWVLVCAPSLWRCYNILYLHFHLTFTCYCLRILSLTANATILQGSPRGWEDNKPVKAGSGGWVGGLNSELGPRWIICFRGLVTEVLRELTWDTLWDLDLGECPRSKAVELLSKKSHSHHNVIRSQRRYFRWLASFFALHYTHSLRATPFFERQKELSGSLCSGWRTGQGWKVDVGYALSGWTKECHLRMYGGWGLSFRRW